jgi:hypothetical protein
LLAAKRAGGVALIASLLNPTSPNAAALCFRSQQDALDYARHVADE